MQRDIGRTCNVDCTEICGVSPTKNHREKTRRRCDPFSVRTSYGSSLSMSSAWSTLSIVSAIVRLPHINVFDVVVVVVVVVD